MARQERAIRTRGVILEAAATVFDELGYEAATISEILKRAGVTKGAFYFHFPSKEDLAWGLLDQAVTTEGVRPQPIKLQEVVDTMLIMAHRLPREPVFSSALRLSVDRNSQRLFGTRWPDWISLLTSLLGEAKERGEIYPYLDETTTARLLLSAWTGVQIVSEGLPEEHDLSTEVSRMLQLMLPSIAVPTVLSQLEVFADRGARLLAAALPDTEADDTTVEKNAATTAG
ncbi:ScbR family autoregulator-binding transcription factor [Streptomyces lanatus]|uniref:ScbR family autoregulator-binding transcription factor n=1 Tax=Streptomyces lanatus TaxID=66900 RepID=A0ABV1Y3Y6_9ACTN|nr:ScbR family autoregulator-binding transcription factor [Streptomyces lanatus]GHH27690.1 gamma-butyrolactone-binding protein [Streptomyces lanatus]